MEEGCKRMFSILCMHFFIAYQNYVLSETRAIDVNHRFLVIESNFCRYYLKNIFSYF